MSTRPFTQAQRREIRRLAGLAHERELANAAGQLQISWPTDHTGWQLQSQTNNLTSGLGTNWVNLPASMQTNQMTVPLNSANGSVFFRLMRP